MCVCVLHVLHTNRYTNVIDAVLACVEMLQTAGEPNIDVKGARDLSLTINKSSSSTQGTENLENLENLENPEEDKVDTRQLGDRVKAKCSGWSNAYYGQITAINENGTYAITFEDGDVQENVQENQIKVDGAEVKYEVGLKVRAKFAGKGHFYPAIISKVNVDGTFDLKYMDGDWEEGALKDNLTVC